MSTGEKSRFSPPALRIRDLTRLCKFYGIKNVQDSLAIGEFSMGEGRMDLMTVNLQNFLIRGYEFKRTRSDFLGDEKWMTYLPYVNYFYFVTPPDVIKKGELPPEVYHLEARWRPSEYQKNKNDGFWGLSTVKRGKRLQPKFVRETYGEQFFHRLLLQYVRAFRWRETCADCFKKREPEFEKSAVITGRDMNLSVEE